MHPASTTSPQQRPARGAYDARIHFCFFPCKEKGVSLKHPLFNKMRANRFVLELNGIEIFHWEKSPTSLNPKRKMISASSFVCINVTWEKREGRKSKRMKIGSSDTCSVSTVAPIISGHVSPLKNALGASQIVRQFVESLEDLVSWPRIISDRSIFRPKQMLVQAILVHFLVLVGHRTRTELEVTVVIRREFHTDRYHRACSILSHYHTISVFATCLVQTRL